MTLIDAKNGETVTIIKINGGRAILGHLNSLGIIPKTRVKIINNGPSGITLLKLNDSVMAIGKGVCSKIIIDYN